MFWGGREVDNLRTAFSSVISVGLNFRNCDGLSMANKRAHIGNSGKNKFIFVTLNIHQDMLD
jgi:hypothetical protein